MAPSKPTALTVALGVCLVALPRALWAQAVIEGAVKLPAATAGTPATARYQDKISGKVGEPPPPEAVVYLEGAFPTASASAPTATAQMGQKNYRFSPALLVVQKGTRVEFPNFDDDYHNVLSYSKAKEFDLGRYRKDEKAPAILFDKAGAIELACEIHEHMGATILVLDTPHFTKTDAQGRYRLANLPAGKFTIKAWVNRKTVWSQPVELKAGETRRVDLPVATESAAADKPSP